MTKKYHPHELEVISERIKNDIDEWCSAHFAEERRTHLGASVIGNACARQIWYGWRWVLLEKFGGRMLRLFNRGHLEEHRMIKWLEGVGFKLDTLTADGKQHRIEGYKGHFGGSNDSQGTHEIYVQGLPLVVEFKTHNDKSFTKLAKDGVQKAKPEHYKQMCMYGEAKGYRYGLYLATNKDTDELWPELVELKWELAGELHKKAAYIIDTKNPPARIAEHPSYFECKFCVYTGICHKAEPYEKNCRSCHYATAVEGGQWVCDLYAKIIPADFIPKGCPQHREVGRV